MTTWIKERFTLHEMWALKTAERWPLFALFFVATFWVWAIPFLPFLIVYWIAAFEWPLLTFVPSMILGLGFIFFVTHWIFRWYFIALDLMFQKTGMAEAKRTDLEKRLAM